MTERELYEQWHEKRYGIKPPCYGETYYYPHNRSELELFTEARQPLLERIEQQDKDIALRNEQYDEMNKQLISAMLKITLKNKRIAELEQALRGVIALCDFYNDDDVAYLDYARKKLEGKQ